MVSAGHPFLTINYCGGADVSPAALKLRHVLPWPILSGADPSRAFSGRESTG